MNTFNDYLKYRLRASLLRTVAFTVIALIVTYYSLDGSLAMWTVEGDFGATYYYEVPGGIYSGYLDLSSLSSLLAIAAVVIAALELSCFNNKRNLDMFYSMPLSRFQLGLAHYVSGALQMLAVHTACVLMALAAALPYMAHLKLWLLPAYYIFSLIFRLGLYSFVCFFFIKGNTDTDGGAFVMAWFCVPYSLLGTLGAAEMFSPYLSDIPHSVYDNLINGYGTWGMADSALRCVGTVFADMIGAGKNFEASAEQIMDTFYMFYIWAAIYAACAYGFFRSFMRRSAEKTAEVSESPVGYKFLIPFFGFCLIISIGDMTIAGVFIPLFMALGYIVYRRGVKLKKRDIVAVVAALLLVIMLAVLPRTLEQMLPIPAAAVLTFALLIRLINAVSEKEGKREVAKRAVIFTLSLMLLALLIFTGRGVIDDLIRIYVLRLDYSMGGI